MPVDNLISGIEVLVIAVHSMRLCICQKL